jgi:hypothetical protein
VLYAEQVHVMFRARLLEPTFGPGIESLEVKLVGESEIPWPEIAFASGDFALRCYLDDRAQGLEGVHYTTFDAKTGRGPKHAGG